MNLVIEFNGDIWHANPELYNENDKPFPFDRKYTAKEIWQKDAEKIKFLKTKVDNVIIIWEKELKDNGMCYIIEKLIKEIKEYGKI